MGRSDRKKSFLENKVLLENSVSVCREAFMTDSDAITPSYQKKGPRKGLGPRGAENLSHFRERLVLLEHVFEMPLAPIWTHCSDTKSSFLGKSIVIPDGETVSTQGFLGQE